MQPSYRPAVKPIQRATNSFSGPRGGMRSLSVPQRDMRRPSAVDAALSHNFNNTGQAAMQYDPRGIHTPEHPAMYASPTQAMFATTDYHAANVDVIDSPQRRLHLGPRPIHRTTTFRVVLAVIAIGLAAFSAYLGIHALHDNSSSVNAKSDVMSDPIPIQLDN